MSKATTVTLKIINDDTILNSLPKPSQLTEEQKELIRMVAREAVEEYVHQMRKFSREVRSHDRIVRLREVAEIVGLARSTIYLRIKEGSFPKPISLGKRSVGWKESQITAWLDS